MKCLPLLTLLVALSIVPVTSAQTEEQRARKNAAIAKFAQRAATQPRAIARGQSGRSNFNAGAAATIRASRGRTAASYNSDISVRPRGGRPVISQTRMFQPTSPVVRSSGAGVFTPNRHRLNLGTGNRRDGNLAGAGRNRLGHNRGDGNGVWNGTDWRTRNGTANSLGGRRRGGGAHRAFHNRHEGDPNFAQSHRRWHRQHQHRSWWRSHYTRFALFGGGYYYWNSGYWYPAYGYDPYFSTYAYDAPIYGYNDLEPQQVIANVQAALQRLGYDPGGVDGEFGPLTRRALLDYQQDNGLEVTGEIDEATLNALGLE